jgi:hypothetical protein
LIKITFYFKNRSSTKSLLDTTPWESFYGEKSNFSNFSNLRIIELLVYCHNVEIETGLNRRIKSDPKACQTRLIGYNKGFSQYKIWNFINNKIEEITFIHINESDYIIILKELEEQKIILSLFNESEDLSSNSKIVEISIPPINFDRDEYELLSIFIHHCPDLLTLTKMNESDINKEFINFK